jgi:N-carbamoyl-L-amino-acid hydrolase
MIDDALVGEFRACFDGLAAVGRDPAGGYHRLAWTDQDRAARAWFAAQATARGLSAERDANGNLWAWWYPPAGAAPGAAGALVLGSHLDTVPRGGA